MAVAGVFSLMQLPINSLRQVTPGQVLIMHQTGPLFAVRCRKTVSYPIETAMNGLPDVKPGALDLGNVAFGCYR
jgi:cobalt-zinc-cadmium resistance protein CzcA